MQKDRQRVGFLAGRRGVITLACLVIVGLLGASGYAEGFGDASASTERLKGRPNVLLVTVDTLRADHLGCYGYFRDTSPTLDALVGDAIFFERCLVPVAQTLPSHLSLMTGVYPLEHGITSNLEKPGGQRFASTPQLRTTAEFFKSKGYTTAAFVSATPLKRSSGIAAGFDVFSEPSHARRLGAETTQAVEEWLASRPAEPFFLWVHYFDPHAPYDPPSPYDEMFQTDPRLEALLTARSVPSRVQKQRNDRRVVPEDEAWDTRKAINGYDGEIRYVDDQIKALIAALRERSQWDRTVFAFTSDHGEGLGQHGIVMHDAVWFEQLHVPLLIRVPGMPGRRVSHAIRTIDVIPTLLSLAPDLHADDYLKQCRGLNVLSPGYKPVDLFGQEPGGRSETYTLVSGDWKLVIGDSAGELLFHLPTDPHELKNVAKDQPDVVRQMRDKLRTLLADQKARGRHYQQGRPSVPVDDAGRAKRQEELRGLGYMDTEEPDEEEDPE